MSHDRPRKESRIDTEEAPRGKLSRFEASGEQSAKREAIRDGGGSLDPDMEFARLTRVRVDDDGVQRPFMMGILVHSLTETGLSFEDAYAVARGVWQRVRDRKLVTKSELSQLASELAKAAPEIDIERFDPNFEQHLDVLGKDGRRPFNQGRLQQSLLASGIEPRHVFEVVLEIERVLRSRGERRVERDSIRRLAADILDRRFGESSARRYRAWRQFHVDEERPVIVLLGGTSGVGKSALGLEVARRLSIARVLSTDSIRDVMRVMVSEELVPTLHVSSFEAHSRLVSDVSPGLDPVVEGFLEQSRTVAVGVRAVIERAILEGTSTVLDGVSLVPGLFDVSEWQDRAHLCFLLAADQDQESLHGHLVARAHGRGARATERYVRSFKEIFQIQENLLERAETFGVPVVDVQDLDVAARQVVKHVVDQLASPIAARAAGLD